MGRKGKVLITEQGRFDLDTYVWDDHLFSDVLVKENQIDTKQAMDISKFIRESIDKLEENTITAPAVDKVLKTKLLEYGFSQTAPIRLDKSIFKKNGLAISKNAKIVLRRRYLKKDKDGNVIETPASMFSRVARHIAKAETIYGDSDQTEKMEKLFMQHI